MTVETSLLPPSKAKVADLELEINQAIQYKIPDEDIISDAKIERFEMIDKTDMRSVWMYVIDINSGDKHWLSLRNWKELYDAEAFNKIAAPVEMDVPW